jgi:hypothetical protein
MLPGLEAGETLFETGPEAEMLIVSPNGSELSGGPAPR